MAGINALQTSKATVRVSSHCHRDKALGFKGQDLNQLEIQLDEPVNLAHEPEYKKRPSSK